MIRRRVMLYDNKAINYISWKPYNSSWTNSSFYITNSSHIDELVLQNYTENSINYTSALLILKPTLTTLDSVCFQQEGITDVEINLTTIKPTSLEMAFVETSSVDTTVFSLYRNIYLNNIDFSNTLNMNHAFSTVLHQNSSVGSNKYTKLYKSDGIFNFPVVETLAGAFSYVQFQLDTSIQCGNSCRSTAFMFTYADGNNKIIDISQLDTSNVLDMSYMFFLSNESILNNIDFNYLNTNNVTDMTYMFGYNHSTNFHEKVLNLCFPQNYVGAAMFYGTGQGDFWFNYPMNTVNAEAMFAHARCSSIYLSEACITNAYMMFYGCLFLYTLDLSNTTFEGNNLLKTFMGCKTLESIDLTPWDLINVTSFHETFCDCGSLREIRFGGEANTIAYSDTLDMFTGCVSLEYIFIPAEYQDTWNFLYNVEMPNSNVQIITY